MLGPVTDGEKGSFEDVERFVEDHRPCDDLMADADPPTTDGYRVLIRALRKENHSPLFSKPMWIGIWASPPFPAKGRPGQPEA